MIAPEDRELFPWIAGIMLGEPHRAEGFLPDLAVAALHADADEYELIRPSLIRARIKHPIYRSERRRW